MLALVIAASLACGASGDEDQGGDPAAYTYLRGPFTTAPSDTALPDVVNPIPSATSVIYLAWSHANLPQNEQLTFTLTALDVGAAAPPNTVVASMQRSVPEAGPHHGPVQFSLPRPWPPGSYRATAVGSTIGSFGTVDFRIQ